MQKVFSLILVLLLSILVACAPAHRACPGNASTGNYALVKRGHSRHTKCPGTSSTGTIKPKQNNRIEDGIMSKKMKRSMEKNESSK